MILLYKERKFFKILFLEKLKQNYRENRANGSFYSQEKHYLISKIVVVNKGSFALHTKENSFMFLTFSSL